MKGPTIIKDLLFQYLDGTDVASRETNFILQSKLLSSKGCDSVGDGTEGDRKAESDVAVDKKPSPQRGNLK